VDGFQSFCKFIKDRGLFYLNFLFQPNWTKNKEIRPVTSILEVSRTEKYNASAFFLQKREKQEVDAA
jgi:hypothetical protein